MAQLMSHLGLGLCSALSQMFPRLYAKCAPAKAVDRAIKACKNVRKLKRAVGSISVAWQYDCATRRSTVQATQSYINSRSCGGGRAELDDQHLAIQQASLDSFSHSEMSFPSAVRHSL